MDFRTIVGLPPKQLELVPASHVMMLGSCFADYIGEKIKTALPEGAALVNPFGVLYNPESIRMSIVHLLSGENMECPELCFKGNDGLWHHWNFSGICNAPSKETCLQQVSSRCEEARGLLCKADVLIVTFSNDHAYCLASGENRGRVVANCHKQPAADFNEVVLDFDEQFVLWDALLKELTSFRPTLKVLFTLSPYRYLKYGLMESQMGKARLLHLIGKLASNNTNALYFPTYEIVVDELRDYRFYERDMLHPSAQTVDYVWERFQYWCFSSDLVSFSKDKQALLRFLSHRPLHEENAGAHQEACEKRKKEFIVKWNHIIQ